MKKQFLLSFIISFIFLSLGFFLLHKHLIGYGFSFFALLPFIIGFILGKSILKKISLIGLIISLLTFFILLYNQSLEGMVCIVMSLPIIIISIALGALIKYLINKYYKKNESDNLLKSSILPLFVFLGVSFLENIFINNEKKTISISTEVILPFSNIEVYDAIKNVDTLIANKSFLMKLDLPVPKKCILEKEAVGGLRTCYFDGGKIIEKISAIEKGKLLQMDVIDYQLTGRKWLGFKEAIYKFESVGENNCKIIRITTYTSELMPRFYWQPLEGLGISQEHDYVFENLKNDLNKKYISK